MLPHPAALHQVDDRQQDDCADEGDQMPACRLPHENEAPRIDLVLGSVYFDGRGGKTCNIEKFIFHPNWNPATSGNDVALVQMDCIVDFTNSKHSTGSLISSGTIDPVRSPVYRQKTPSR